MISDDLRSKATNFAAEIQGILTRTITNYAQIRAVSWDSPTVGRTFVVGHCVSRDSPFPRRFPLRARAGQATLWMEISYQLRMDDEQQYLTVHKSFFGVFPDEGSKEGLCHYDYEREKDHGYPDAHLQVYGRSEVLETVRQDRALSKLHFPVGGKRFRPCLEDLIEFLAREGLVDAKDGYRETLEPGRQAFLRNQLKAAMRCNPEVVEEFLEEHDLPSRSWQERFVPGRRRKGSKKS